MANSIRSARPRSLRNARPQVDMAFPQASHGPILPMEEPGFFARLFGRR